MEVFCNFHGCLRDFLPPWWRRDPEEAISQAWDRLEEEVCDGICVGIVSSSHHVDWGTCWMDLWTNERRDTSGNISVHHAEASVASLTEDAHWYKLREEAAGHIGTFDLQWVKGRMPQSILSDDYEDWGSFRHPCTDYIMSCLMNSERGSDLQAEAYELRSEAIRTQRRKARLAAVKKRRRELERKFGVPWDINFHMERSGFWEWGE